MSNMEASGSKEKDTLKQALVEAQDKYTHVESQARQLALTVENLQNKLVEAEQKEQIEKENIEKAIQIEKNRILKVNGDNLVRGKQIFSNECQTVVLGTDDSIILAGSLYPLHHSNGFARVIKIPDTPNDDSSLILNTSPGGRIIAFKQDSHTFHILQHNSQAQYFSVPKVASVRQISITNGNNIFVLYSNGDVMHSDRLPYSCNRNWTRLIFAEPIEKLSTSQHSMLALGKSGKVYGMGSNRLGQLGVPGYGTNLISADPYFIYEPEMPEPAKDIFVTEANGAVIGVSGKLYITGSYMARTGLGEKEKAYLECFRKFEHVPTEGPVVNVALGGFHTMIILEDGRLFGCGLNTAGQLGHPIRPNYSSYSGKDDIDDGTGQIGQRSQFISIPLPQGIKAKQVTCGSFHTVVLLENNQVLGFGCNKYGEIGVEALPPRVQWTNSEFSSPGESPHPIPANMRFW